MKKRTLFYIIGISLFVILLSVFYLDFTKVETEFHNICQNIVSDQLTKNSLHLHFNYVNPEKANIDASTIRLPLYSKSSSLNEYQSYKAHLKNLKKIKLTDLSTEEKNSYYILKYCLENDLKSKEYFYFRTAFSPASGIQLEFPLLMAEYKFHSKKDVENYLELLKLFPLYMDSYVIFEKERVEKGFALPDFTLHRILNQCDEFILSLQKNPKKHFLVSEFAKKLVILVESGAISEDEYHSYKKENLEILCHNFLPAYEKLKLDLSAFLGKSKNDAGLCLFKNGDQYYEYLFQTVTASDAKIDEVYEFLSNHYYNQSQKLQLAYQKFIKDCSLNQEEINYFPLDTPEEMLNHLSSKMASDFPPLNTDLCPTKQLRIKYVADSLQNYTAPAYYVLPPLDYFSVNSIYINPKEKSSSLSLYNTMAHEGFPGHLYQTNIYSNFRNQQQIHDIRGIINFGGYAEGWAIYTEFLSYDYATELLVEKTNKKEYKDLLNIYKLDKDCSMALLSLLDIAIHYYGIQQDRVSELLSAHGIHDLETQKEIFEYIVEEPCNYSKYYWGYQEMLKLKNEMKEIQGPLYTEYGFHKFILENGPTPFPILHQKLVSMK